MTTEHVEYAWLDMSWAIVVGNFARGQSRANGHTVWMAYNQRIGTFATGQRDSEARINVKVIR